MSAIRGAMIGYESLMVRTFALCAALLMLPIAAAQLPARAQSGESPPAFGFQSVAPPELRVLEQARQPGIQHQVRIEGRVVIRVAPSSDATRARIMAELPRRAMSASFEEVAQGDCVAMEGLVGVQPLSETRLLLFTRDRQVLTASLERGCNAQSYYSGFYVERNDDGRLCVDRDELRSRAGASCEVTQLRRLVAIRN